MNFEGVLSTAAVEIVPQGQGFVPKCYTSVVCCVSGHCACGVANGMRSLCHGPEFCTWAVGLGTLDRGAGGREHTCLCKCQSQQQCTTAYALTICSMSRLAKMIPSWALVIVQLEVVFSNFSCRGRKTRTMTRMTGATQPDMARTRRAIFGTNLISF